MANNIKNTFTHKNAVSSEARQEALMHLHEELYDILAEILRVCEILGLHPFLQGGSAIGAFFDKGIIPWDDDIDVGLVRDEYESFIKQAPAVIRPDYFVQCFDSEPNMLMASLLKVRKNGTFFSEEGWDDIPLHHGIFVDIMPYDMVPDNQRRQRRQRFTLRKIENVLQNKMLWKYWYKKRFFTDSFSNFILSVKACLWSGLFSRQLAYKLYNKVSTKYNGRQGCSFYNQAKQKRDHIAISSIENIEEVPFGPLKAFIPGDVETYLRHHYPNLRPTLPEGERESHMPERIKFSDGTVFGSFE